MWQYVIAVCCYFCSTVAIAVVVTDDYGQQITLTKPPQHVVTLAPHLTELLYSATDASQLVGVSRYSDYPPAAQNKPIVSDANSIDFEALIQLKTDFAFVWASAITKRDLQQFQALGIPVYVHQPRDLKSISKILRDMSLIFQLPQGMMLADNFEQFLAKWHRTQKNIDVFILISINPAYSVNGEQFISQVLSFCGGHNVFADLPVLAPAISRESYLKQPVDLILTSLKPALLQTQWRDFEYFAPKMLFVAPEHLLRPTLRIQQGIEDVCTAMDRISH